VLINNSEHIFIKKKIITYNIIYLILSNILTIAYNYVVVSISRSSTNISNGLKNAITASIIIKAKIIGRKNKVRIEKKAGRGSQNQNLIRQKKT